jgi:predicted Zn-dependent peptidase
MIAPEGALGNLTANCLADFVERNYTPKRMVLCGAGVGQVFPVSLSIA